ncbi:ABC transporter substrate-binding protein [Chelativorans xinjiangense]|uniref:ABC transporter substrate-binding protein n=1 Tax=Chelativorans xinjiangense TaxID=2681485 RepID=UPI001356E176|nr:ABC transporter substrate-binding protein [Chelativorans xinjiangense]
MRFARYALSAAALGVGINGTTAVAQELIVNSYGGPYEEIIYERIIKPFQEQSGIKVIYDAVGSSSQDYAKIKATKGSPGFDVVVMTASQSLDGCKDGILEKLTVENVPNLAFLDPDVSAMASECGAVHEVQYMSLLYRTDHIKQAPDSWEFLFSEELDDKIVLPTFENIMAVYLMEVFSTMNGGSLLEIDPGFEKMVELAPRAIAFEQSSAVLDKYVREGQAWAMPYWSGRAQLMKDDGVPVDYIIPKEGTIPLLATLNVPIGAQNKEAALEFVNFFLEKTSQEAWMDGYKVGSIRSDVEVSDEIRAKQITSKEDIQKLLLPDPSTIAERLPQWGDKWQREVIPAAK